VNEEELLYTGKAKSVYRSGVDGELIVRFRDDITAFDGGKKDVLQKKGEYNASVSAYFFPLLEEHGIPTHFIRMADPSTMIVRELSMIPLEVIVRNRAAGSIVKRYPFEEGAILDPPVIVIDYKDDARHDPMLNDDLILALHLVTRSELRQIKEMAIAINALLVRFFASIGISLVDFKIEFGKAGETLYLGDEISMDSMRLWDMTTGESLDKDVYRFDKGDVMEAYERVAHRIQTSVKGGVQ
jgi:phosphoribosylaminoimidazole-succinocarboxamide synthase